MDGYPGASLDHNIPLIFVTGLTSELAPELQEQAILIRSELPPVEGRDAEAVWKYFLSVDASDAPWNGRDTGRAYRFRVRTAGRSFYLPPRRAKLPDGDEPLKSATVLHSPFSPLSPVSPLYPDGVINSQWLDKHQELVPSVLVCFYQLTSDSTLATLQDNKLKTDVNQLKIALSKAGYMTRIAVALLSDGPASPLPPSGGITERLENIRKGTGLDPKVIFYIAPRETVTELEEAADKILTSLFVQAVDYYRDLGRHARKKRGKGVAPQPSLPPTSGTSQTLSLQGWNVRYDFKAGVFAEFRQDMDAALRSFEQAYEGLVSTELLDIIPSWSPRWNEARLLADIISVRCLRALLWASQTTSAVRRWQSHRDRMMDFVDRRGPGTNNYGWKAWEARWAMVMADLMDRVDIQDLAPSTGILFLQPEKLITGERLQPWEMLHHKGYWYRSAARHLAARRTLAYSIPEEDRRPPDASPASGVANQSYAYDTYMCPGPYEEYPLNKAGVNHSQLIIDCLMSARSEFQSRNQLRFSAELSLESAKEMVHLEAWQDVVAVLRPLWEDMSFRAEGWLDITEDLSWTLRSAAENAGLGELVVAIDWELHHKKFNKRPGWHYDMAKSLEQTEGSSKPSVRLRDDMISSFVSASFVFKSGDGKAGEACLAQLAVTSSAFPDAAPVVLQGLKVDFEGSLRTIVLEHEPSKSLVASKDGVVLSVVSLEEDKSPGDDFTAEEVLLRGKADLTVKPGQTRVYEMAVPLREPGDAQASSIAVSMQTDSFDLEYTVTFRETNAPDVWYGQQSRRRRIAGLNAHTIHVEPRPPKMEIQWVEPLEQYYANEPIELLLCILNAEEVDANTKLEVHFFGEDLPEFTIEANNGEMKAAATGSEASKIGNLVLGTIGTASSVKATLLLEPSEGPTSYDITVKTLYHLVTDPSTPILQVMAFQLNIVNPFEANYDLVPRLHPDPWPSLFDSGWVHDQYDDPADAKPWGLAQKWCLVCHYASFASEDVTVLEMDVKVLACLGGAKCTTTRRPSLPETGFRVSPKTMQEAQFDLIAQKLSLDDTGPASLDLAFIIRWRRLKMESGPVNNTTMLVPRYIVLGTEPRVVASASYGSGSLGLVQLNITIENASNHFLTFGLTMEPSDEFAFSGAKQTTLHVLPVSRRSVTYRLLPLVRSKYVRPALVVRDKYFQKVLRIIPTEGMKIDKDGLLLWIPSEDDKGED